MKNTKRYLLVVLAAVIAVATIFALSSCGHKHKYDPVVTKPTCTEQGYTKYVCSCGESYIDENTYVDAKHDLVEHGAKPANCTEAGHEAYVTCKNCDYTTYKEIPAGEHYYDCSIVKIPTAEKAGKAIYTCEGCGDSYEAEITLEDIELPDVMGFIASIIGDGYYSIDLGDGFNLIMIKEITEDKEHYEETEDVGEWITDTTFEGTKTFLAVKLPKAYLDIKNAYMKAEIEVQIGTAKIGFEEDDDPEEIALVDFDVESSYALKIDGNKIDVNFASGEDTEEYSATVYELALLLVSRYTGAELEYETMLEIYAVLQQLECFVPVFETISEKLAALENVESDVDFTALISILTALGSDVIKETADGDNTVYTLELQNLSKYIDYLKEATVADMLNDAFGEGFADTLKEFVVSVPALTVKEIADAAIAVSESYGLNVDEFYALVNGIVYLATGAEFDIAGEIDKRNEYTLAKIVAEIMSAPADQMDEAAASFTAQVEEIITMILGSTVDDLFELIAPKKDAPAEPMDPDAEEEIEPEEDKSLTEILEGFVAMLGDAVEATVVIDANGNVKDIDFSIAGQVTGSYEVDEDGNVSATVKIVDVEFVYSSEDGAYTLVVNAAGSKIVEGELTITDEGYNFTGKVYAGEVTANLTVDIGLDGTLDVLLTVVGGEADVELTAKLDKENVDVTIKSESYILLNLDVDLKDGEVVKVNFDGYNLLRTPSNDESEDETPAPPTIEYEHAFGLYYLNNGEGTYTLKIKIPAEKAEVSLSYDGENFDAVIKDDEKIMFNLYVDIADGKITAVDMDIYSYIDEKQLKKEYADDPDFDINNLPDSFLYEDLYELVEVKRHTFALDYIDNGDTTYSLNIAVPYDEVKVELALDLTNKTLTFKATESVNTVTEGTITVTDGKLIADAKAYDDEEVMDIDLELSAEGLTFTLVLTVAEEQYTIMSAEIIVENNVVTSAHFVNNALYTDESDDPDEVPEKELVNILDITYTYSDDVATIVFKTGDAAEAVITVTIGDNGVTVDALVKTFDNVYDDEGNVVDTEETVLFDGQLGFSVTDENGKHSFTVSADMDKIVSDSNDYDYDYDYETDTEYYIYILKTLILAFDGEITFSYTEA